MWCAGGSHAIVCDVFVSIRDVYVAWLFLISSFSLAEGWITEDHTACVIMWTADLPSSLSVFSTRFPTGNRSCNRNRKAAVYDE
jgi:hypothetical protein